MKDRGWMRDAKCARLTTEVHELFFPDPPKGGRPKAEAAKRICRRCPVKVSCLFYSVAHQINHGVWGGLTEHQRRRMSRPLKSRIRHQWFQQHPLAEPMKGMGYYLVGMKRQDRWEDEAS